MAGNLDFEEIDRDKSECGNGPHDSILQSLAADPDDCDENNRRHSRFERVEDCRDPRQVAECCVNITQDPQDEDRRYDEQRAGHDATSCLVQEPANVDR